MKTRCLLLGAVAMTAAGCGGPPSAGEPGFPAACELLPAPEVRVDSITLGYDIAGVHDEERRLATILPVGPVRVDCEGTLRPGFVTDWAGHDGGRRWTLTIRDDLQRKDGTPVTARWLAHRWSVDRRLFDTGVDSVAVSGKHSLDVYVDRSHAQFPRVLSHRLFAIPLAGHRPRLGFVRLSEHDVRDLLAGPLDFMFTLDPDVVEYASTQPDLSVIPLPWERVYVLISPSRVRSVASGDAVPRVSPQLLADLADDAVRGEARAASGPFWWDDFTECAPVGDEVPWAPPPPPSQSNRRLVYEREDPVARQLAERIVALASAAASPSAQARELAAAIPGLTDGLPLVAVEDTAVHLDGTSLNETEFAYIVAFPRRVTDECFERRRLIDRVRWLLPVEGDLAGALIPLVEARQYAIARKGKLGLEVDWYGNVRIVR